LQACQGAGWGTLHRENGQRAGSRFAAWQGLRRFSSHSATARGGRSDLPVFGDGAASNPISKVTGPFIRAFFIFLQVNSIMSFIHRFAFHRSPVTCLLGGLLVGLVATEVHGAGNERWVSDTLSTYVRSGPTDGYRIVGTVKSGQKLELINTQGDYSQVKGESGDTVWLPSSNLQDVPGPVERVPQLTQQVTELSTQLKTIDDSWKQRVQGMQETLDSRKALIDDLQGRSKALSDELAEAQSDLRSAQAKLGDENKQVMMSYMVYGGSIAGAGLLAGLILPALSRGRKRKDRWF
jgi:SH3 domain protein